jgi:N-acetyltransferase
VFLYIQNKQILGCLVAEDIDKANRMLDLPQAVCSEEFFPASCGISRIWTAQSTRRKGVASRLVDSMRFVLNFKAKLDIILHLASVLRENFLSYKTLAVEEIAFSSPSVSGREFAAKYTGNPCFLVFQ